MKRRLLARAVHDLADIEARIATDDPQAAADVALRLKKALDLITLRPDIGRPSKRAGIREWSVPDLPYVIPYRVKETHIEILRVFHTRRKRPAEW